MTGYNSKHYYVIRDDGPNGQKVFRLPITGRETVLDAIVVTGGLTDNAQRDKIVLVRPRDKGPANLLLAFFVNRRTSEAKRLQSRVADDALLRKRWGSDWCKRDGSAKLPMVT